jgi:chromosome segregation ATPase
MKPAEILVILEDAAEVRIFEKWKENTLKTIAEKDQKVQEINAL